jgi:hypothetical protein
LDGTVIDILLGFEDRNAIKYLRDLATDDSDTYIELASATIEDMSSNRNEVESVSSVDAVQVTAYQLDDVDPILLAFDLDMHDRVLTLSFDETVETDGLNVDTIGFTYLSSTMTPYYLTESSGTGTSDDDSDVVTIDLSDEDFNELAKLSVLPLNPEKIRLTVTAAVIKDMNTNQLTDITGVDLDNLPITGFIPDEKAPSIVSFDLDLQNEELTLTFSETILASSVDVTEFTIVGAQNSADERKLQFGTKSEIDSTVIVVYLDTRDLNYIKEVTSLATDSGNSLLYFTSAAVTDMNSNSVTQVDTDAAKVVRPEGYTADDTRPTLVEFAVDMTTRQIALTFDETVDGSKAKFAQFTLSNSATLADASQQYTLAVENAGTIDSTIIVLQLELADVIAIQILDNLFTNADNSFLFMTSYAIVDMVGLPVQATTESAVYAKIFNSGPPQQDCFKASAYQQDTKAPNLLQVDLDLDLNLDHLVLYFDETVDVSTYTANKITIHSTAVGGTSYELVSGQVLTTDGPMVKIQLSKTDRDAIKLFADLAIGKASAYVTVASGAFIDMTSSALANNNAANDLQVENYVVDNTDPILESFQVNIDKDGTGSGSGDDGSGSAWNSQEGTITLNFNEPVNTANYNPKFLVFQSAEDSGDTGNTVEFFRLTGGATASANGLSMTAVITNADLNEVKLLESLYIDEDHTWLYLQPGAITDMAFDGNSVVEIASTAAQQVSSGGFVEDNTRPNVISFDLDMTEEVLTLRFKEPMDVKSFDIEKVTLQASAATAPGRQHTLTLGDVAQGSVDDTVVYVKLELHDLNELKRKVIGREASTTFLTLTEDAIMDQNGKKVMPLVSGENAMSVGIYESDETDPVLEEFDLDLTAEVLTLRFSETVRGNTLNPTQITFHRAVDGVGSSFQLTADSKRSTKVVPFASVGATCTANSNAQASTVCKLNADSSGCATADSGCTYEAMPTSDNNWVQTIALGTLDLNILKRMNDLATKEDGSDTFVAITTSFIDDMYGNEVTQIDETSTNQLLPVTKYEFDLTDPKLVSFCFNMHDGELIMTFDETVDSANLVVAELTMQTSSDHGGIFTDHLDLDSDFNTKFTTESNTVVTVSLNSHDMNLMKINQMVSLLVQTHF